MRLKAFWLVRKCPENISMRLEGEFPHSQIHVWLFSMLRTSLGFGQDHQVPTANATIRQWCLQGNNGFSCKHVPWYLMLPIVLLEKVDRERQVMWQAKLNRPY